MQSSETQALINEMLQQYRGAAKEGPSKRRRRKLSEEDVDFNDEDFDSNSDSISDEESNSSDEEYDPTPSRKRRAAMPSSLGKKKKRSNSDSFDDFDDLDFVSKATRDRNRKQGSTRPSKILPEELNALLGQATVNAARQQYELAIQMCEEVIRQSKFSP